MPEEGRINPVMLKVHFPICVIVGFCIVMLLILTGNTSIIHKIGFLVLFDVIYFWIIARKVEQQSIWIPVRGG